MPKRYYLDPDVLELEKDRIFGSTWQLVARTDDLQRVGDFVPVTVLDEPVVITHGLERRAARLLQRVPPPGRPGRAHEGQPQVAPVPLPRLDLRAGRLPARRARDGGHRGLLEGRLRADARARRSLGPVRLRQPRSDIGAAPRRGDGRDPSEVASAGYDVERMRLVERRDYVIECNWKVYVDNYLEGYHLPIAHPQLFKELDYDSYRVEEFRYYSKQHAPIRELKPGEELGVDRRYLRQPGGGGLGPLLLALPEHDVQHLPGQHVLERDPAAGRGPHADRSSSGSSPSPAPAPAGSRCSRRSPSPTRSSRRTSSSASRSSVASARARTSRPLLRQARERRLPLPEPRPRVPRRLTYAGAARACAPQRGADPRDRDRQAVHGRHLPRLPVLHSRVERVWPERRPQGRRGLPSALQRDRRASSPGTTRT